MQDAEFLSVRRTAVLIDACEKTVRRKIADPIDPLPALRIGDGPHARIRIPRAELMAWLERRRMATPTRELVDEIVRKAQAEG